MQPAQSHEAAGPASPPAPPVALRPLPTDRRTIPETVCDLETSTPDWVIEHPETLAMFEQLGIDYGCGGKSLEYACRERGLDAAQVLAKLLRLLDVKRDAERLGSMQEEFLPFSNKPGGESAGLVLR